MKPRMRALLLLCESMPAITASGAHQMVWRRILSDAVEGNPSLKHYKSK